MNPVKAFERVLSAQRVADRFATDFPSEAALREYLKDHPDADRSKHHVKKDEGGGGSKDEKPKGKHNHPEFSDKSSPYHIDRSNPHLKSLGDPADWDRDEVSKLKEKLKTKVEKIKFKPGSGSKEEKASKDMSEAIRMLSNFNMKTHG